MIAVRPGQQTAAGFFGKIPARGDFVSAGLPRSFVTPWDDWLQQVMPDSRVRLGEDWLDSWMEAPVWRFALPALVCGPDAVIGVFMPSVDRAGRHFPLTLAALPAEARVSDAGVSDWAWLDAAEATGLAALQEDLEPDQLAARLMRAAGETPPLAVADARCRWWTEGAPLVPAGSFTTASLPDSAMFTRMLNAQDAGHGAALGS